MLVTFVYVAAREEMPVRAMAPASLTLVRKSADRFFAEDGDGCFVAENICWVAAKSLLGPAQIIFCDSV